MHFYHLSMHPTPVNETRRKYEKREKTKTKRPRPNTGYALHFTRVTETSWKR